MPADPERIAARLGHRFADRSLLERALTHRSAGGDHNERLEFLGDALLSFLIAADLHRRFPATREGDLTRLRARLVRTETLAALARTLGLGEGLRLGPGELKSGGRDRDSILADALEALIAAVYLDAGIERSTEVVLALYDGLLEALSPGHALKDPKTRLQEWLQGRGLALPRYSVEEMTGEAHEQRFVVACEVEGFPPPTRGEGSSRRAAEQRAAERLLERLLCAERTPSIGAGPVEARSPSGQDGP
jgi:ribonuclease-3